MSRSTTTNLGLGVFDEGDNPGSGSKTVLAGNTGLNQRMLQLDVSVGVGHDSAGAHKSDVIDGPSLKTTTADGITIQLTGTPLKLNVKDDGITGAKIASAVVDNSTLEATASSGAKSFRVKDAGITKAKLATTVADATSIELDASNGLQIKADGVTAAKISHDNNRTKNIFGFAITATDTFGVVHGTLTTTSLGIPMPRAGYITAIKSCNVSATVNSQSWAYGTAAMIFAANDRITVYENSGDKEISIYKNGSPLANILGLASNSAPWIIVVEVEFDD